MVHCYTDDYGVLLTNCINTKIYFVAYGTDDVEVNDIYGGYYWNNGGETVTPYSDGDTLYIYESIIEAESDDEEIIETLANAMLEEMKEADSAKSYLESECVLLGSITMPDPIGFDTNPVATVTWTINNKEVQSLTINNKEIQSIVRVNDNTILYQKAQTPSTPISWNMPLTSYTLTDPYDIIGDGEPSIVILYFDSYINNYEDLINYDYSDLDSFLNEYDWEYEYLPIDLTDEYNLNNGYWVNPIMVYLPHRDVYLLCSYELVDENTLVAKVTENIFE